MGIATIVDGEAVLVRETAKFALKPGMRLDAQDLIETGAQTGLVRLELDGGVVADLGPGTRVMLSPQLGAGPNKRQAALYAVNGWIKTSGGGKDAATPAQVLAGSMDLAKVTGSTVISLQARSIQAFAESGTVLITERRQGLPMPAVTLNPGAFFARTEGGKASVVTPPPPAFVQSVPKAFLDNIPPLASRFKTRPAPPAKTQGDLTYAEALPWLGAERDVKLVLVASWRQHLNADLRAGLVRNIRTHPEWDRVLFPEKYLPTGRQPSTAPASTGTGPRLHN